VGHDHIKQDSDVIGNGKWLELSEIHYADRNGVNRVWESVNRKQCTGAVAVIATLKPSDKLILVRQYRPPADAYVIEFPAGLTDVGETAEITAVRELYEETGYTGVIKQMTAPVYSSPGLTSETVNLAVIEVEESENQGVTPHLDEGEDIETILVKYDDLCAFITDSIDSGDVIDAKVMSFIQGLVILQ